MMGLELYFALGGVCLTIIVSALTVSYKMGVVNGSIVNIASLILKHTTVLETHEARILQIAVTQAEQRVILSRLEDEVKDQYRHAR